jgi:hypothetical protein
MKVKINRSQFLLPLAAFVISLLSCWQSTALAQVGCGTQSERTGLYVVLDISTSMKEKINDAILDTNYTNRWDYLQKKSIELIESASPNTIIIFRPFGGTIFDPTEFDLSIAGTKNNALQFIKGLKPSERATHYQEALTEACRDAAKKSKNTNTPYEFVIISDMSEDDDASSKAEHNPNTSRIAKQEFINAHAGNFVRELGLGATPTTDTIKASKAIAVVAIMDPATGNLLPENQIVTLPTITPNGVRIKLCVRQSIFSPDFPDKAQIKFEFNGAPIVRFKNPAFLIPSKGGIVELVAEINPADQAAANEGISGKLVLTFLPNSFSGRPSEFNIQFAKQNFVQAGDISPRPTSVAKGITQLFSLSGVAPTSNQTWTVTSPSKVVTTNPNVVFNDASNGGSWKIKVSATEPGKKTAEREVNVRCEDFAIDVKADPQSSRFQGEPVSFICTAGENITGIDWDSDGVQPVAGSEKFQSGTGRAQLIFDTPGKKIIKVFGENQANAANVSATCSITIEPRPTISFQTPTQSESIEAGSPYKFSTRASSSNLPGILGVNFFYLQNNQWELLNEKIAGLDPESAGYRNASAIISLPKNLNGIVKLKAELVLEDALQKNIGKKVSIEREIIALPISLRGTRLTPAEPNPFLNSNAPYNFAVQFAGRPTEQVAKIRWEILTENKAGSSYEDSVAPVGINGPFEIKSTWSVKFLESDEDKNIQIRASAIDKDGKVLQDGLVQWQPNIARQPITYSVQVNNNKPRIGEQIVATIDPKLPANYTAEYECKEEPKCQSEPGKFQFMQGGYHSIQVKIKTSNGKIISDAIPVGVEVQLPTALGVEFEANQMPKMFRAGLENTPITFKVNGATKSEIIITCNGKEVVHEELKAGQGSYAWRPRDQDVGKIVITVVATGYPLSPGATPQQISKSNESNCVPVEYRVKINNTKPNIGDPVVASIDPALPPNTSIQFICKEEASARIGNDKFQFAQGGHHTISAQITSADQQTSFNVAVAEVEVLTPALSVEFEASQNPKMIRAGLENPPFTFKVTGATKSEIIITCNGKEVDRKPLADGQGSYAWRPSEQDVGKIVTTVVAFGHPKSPGDAPQVLQKSQESTSSVAILGTPRIVVNRKPRPRGLETFPVGGSGTTCENEEVSKRSIWKREKNNASKVYTDEELLAEARRTSLASTTAAPSLAQFGYELIPNAELSIHQDDVLNKSDLQIEVVALFDGPPRQVGDARQVALESAVITPKLAMSYFSAGILVLVLLAAWVIIYKLLPKNDPIWWTFSADIEGKYPTTTKNPTSPDWPFDFSLHTGKIKSNHDSANNTNENDSIPMDPFDICDSGWGIAAIITKKLDLELAAIISGIIRADPERFGSAAETKKIEEKLLDSQNVRTSKLRLRTKNKNLTTNSPHWEWAIRLESAAVDEPAPESGSQENVRVIDTDDFKLRLRVHTPQGLTQILTTGLLNISPLLSGIAFGIYLGYWLFENGAFGG